jgi:hypothetical protein
MVDSWPFADPPNVSVVTQQSIIKEGRPILLVMHDEEDGGWSFLDGGEFRVETSMLVALKTVLSHDASLAALADLPLGWQAQRARPGDTWKREKSE